MDNKCTVIVKNIYTEINLKSNSSRQKCTGQMKHKMSSEYTKTILSQSYQKPLRNYLSTYGDL